MLLADVDEPLPPTENVLSGFEEKFEPGKDGNEGEEGEDGGDKEGGEEEEEAEEKPVIEVKTASYDHRFPATNQVSLPVHHICPTLASLKLPTSPFLQPNLLQGAQALVQKETFWTAACSEQLQCWVRVQCTVCLVTRGFISARSQIASAACRRGTATRGTTSTTVA